MQHGIAGLENINNYQFSGGKDRIYSPDLILGSPI